ncbi:MAG TPA: 2-oxoglutarate dehydrogenase E1 component [Anaerolineaceae bacterium]|nr:2-oxoglutarate dehydrogenase E1 component [Anaerolineaceae bacterium]
MNETTQLSAFNLGYLIELYERFQSNPQSVDARTREFFSHWQPSPTSNGAVPHAAADFTTAIGVVNLAQAIRTYGHLAAQLDPLGSSPPGDPALELATHGLDEAALSQLPAYVVGGPASQGAENAREAIKALREVYCSRTGFDFGHIHDPEQRDWLRHAAECGEYRPRPGDFDEVALLKRLTQVEGFEQFLHRIFPGKTRFSIEGLDVLVPMLDEFVSISVSSTICQIFIGMAHRGRLNVLAHILSKPYGQILAEFKDPAMKFSLFDEAGWTGDVKYHTGGNRAVVEEETVEVVIDMAPNPSHLEHINPVILGMARAADSGIDQAGAPKFYPKAALPILIHGDAAFPGEGIVSESLNMAHLPGYQVGGTIHIIANNQLGYTTPPEQGRSTLYASDLAKGFEIPVVHVNADDPMACLEATRMAFAYRERFKKDFLIDLIGYRRYGHNEGDEPGFSQPLLYGVIETHARVRSIWADRLVKAGKIDADTPDRYLQETMAALNNELAKLKPEAEIPPLDVEYGNHPDIEAVDTRIPLERLRALNDALTDLPDGFALNRKLAKAMQRRKSSLDDIDTATIDWATAEELALASILEDGTPIRMTGQDVERGTFSQRHAVFFDVENGQRFIPLQAFRQARASFEIQNSPLSENAALGFEYGYNLQNRNCLVIWEAQYGDFINAAQTIVDEFVVSSRAKWGQSPSLVLFLPHGYEGQGPDHSSGRLERFLNLSTGANLRVANCTTAAQLFHLLRLQASLLTSQPVPLVLFTPKSLLRHPLVASQVKDLAEGGWQPVIDDPQAAAQPQTVRRILICSGKIAIDLLESEARSRRQDIAIVRIEQLSPFPIKHIQAVFEAYPRAEEFVWVQEEPENMGAWQYFQARIAEILPRGIRMQYVGRPSSASPSEGSFSWHVQNQAALIAQAFQDGNHREDRQNIAKETVQDKG